MLPSILLPIVLSSTAVTAVPVCQDQPRVQTTTGLLQGHTDPASPHVYQFLGVPYALPPTGPLRWKPPAKPDAATAKATDATDIGPACPQLPLRNAWVYSPNGGNITESFPIEDFSEDCLTLNIWTPALQGDESSSGLPVIVWFFGGGFVQGGTNARYFDPSSWVERSQSHIVVTVNFRSNVFGFPNFPGLEQQNLGLLDQRLSLEWVRENIAQFGGDTARITAWGESSGAIAVDWLSFAYPQDPIMTAMILDSTTALFAKEASITTDSSHANFSFVANAVGCSGTPESNTSAADAVECMRRVSWETIEGVLSSDTTLQFLPIADETVVFSNYTRQYEIGAWPAIPAIVGTTRHELNALVPSIPGTPSQESYYDIAGNLTFLCASAARTSSLRNSGNCTTYRFLYDGDFENVSPSSYPGAYHTTELPMIFGTMGDFHGPSTAFEKQVSQTMQDLWLAFAQDPENGLKEVGWSSYADSKAVVLGRMPSPMEEVEVSELDSVCSKLLSIS